MTDQNLTPDERPPIVRSWKQAYTAVLIIHAVVIIAFLLFKLTFQTP